MGNREITHYSLKTIQNLLCIDYQFMRYLQSRRS